MAKVYIAVGHGIRPDGKYDPGAIDGSRSEQNTCDIIVSRAANLLRQWGVEVIDEAYKDDPNFVGTIRAANAAGVDLVVSCHRDWNKGVKGIFGFWFPGSTGGEKAVRSIVNACSGAGFAQAPAWVKARDDLSLLRRTFAPAALIEYGRVQDYTGAELIDLGEATAVGIARYLGVTPARKAPPAPTAGTAHEAVAEIARLVKHNPGNRWDPADYRAVVAAVERAVGA